MTDAARHAASLRRLANLIERDGDHGEAKAILYLLAKELLREENLKRK